MTANANENQSYPYHLIWLDENIENDTNQENLNKLRQFDENISIFSNLNQCLNYLKTQNDQNTKSSMILIVSKQFSRELINQIQKYQCILGVFIFDKQIEHMKSVDITAICTHIDELIVRIRSCLHRTKTSIDFSFLNKQNHVEQHSIRNLKEDQARFLWFSKCYNFMIELEDDDQQAKDDMLEICRQTYEQTKQTIRILSQFENESLDDNAQNAVYWYAQSSILFRSINEAFVSGNIETIYSYRYMIKLLCRQLKDYHREYKKTLENKQQLVLYRGLQLKLADILVISKHRNDLLSLNGFISTSLEKDIAKQFCFKREKKLDYEPVLLKIDIDLTNEQTVAFADISHQSPFPEEEEILLSIGGIFRIESVEFNEDNQLYLIHLSLSSHEKHFVNNYIEQTFANEVDSDNLAVLFGKLLFDMGEYEFAIKYLQNRIENLSDIDNHHRATYLNNIGVCYNAIDEKDQALKYYKTASRFYEHRENHRGLGACYHNIANYYYNERDYDKASQWALQALQEREKYAVEKATTLDLLGFIQLAKRNAEAASDNFREALQIRLKYLNPIDSNHPDIGISYQNLGRLDAKLSSYIDAQNNFLRAEQIFRHNYPESHPLVKEITIYLKDIQRKLEH